MSMETILVVAAHPDDEVLGSGGTIVKMSGDHPVCIAIMGEGATSRWQQRSEAALSVVGELQAQARAAAELMGARKVTFEGLPDNRFDTLPLLDVVKRVERLIDEVRPSIIYTHSPGDLNVDHQVTFRAVLTATRPIVDCPVKEVYTFEIPSSTEWSFQQLSSPWRPNVFVDITSAIERKIQALQCYRGEVREFPHPRSPEAIRAIARRWGSVAGLEYAEAFELVRSIRL